ncbi:OmpA family protein [Streptomyces sp. CRN 30]|uniref:OmpA family protein n=1 Tax=Streptomyces sp. CRN 30 TaxID=3075613 RepID=UPI002A82C78B|nr:OmpA family protein [Streptomyces sp. CRN 30]
MLTRAQRAGTAEDGRTPAGQAPRPRPVTGLPALQRLAGNAAVTRAIGERRRGPAVQRIVEDDHPTVPERLGMLPDNLPALASADPEIVVGLHPATGLPQMRLETNPEQSEAYLHWSADGSLAVNQQRHAKEFYARMDVVHRANRRLSESGSKLQLLLGDHTVTNAQGDMLVVVRPLLGGQKGADPLSSYMKLTEHQCVEVAERLLGGALNHAVFRDAAGGSVAAYMGPRGKVGTPRLAQAMTREDGPRTPREAAEAAQGDVVAPPGLEYGLATHRELAPVRESGEAIGVNEHVRPRVGEGLTTQTVPNPDFPGGRGDRTDYSRSDGKARGGRVWDYHFAAVVAESLDGTHHITLENFNRNLWAKEFVEWELLGALHEEFGERLNSLFDELAGIQGLVAEAAVVTVLSTLRLRARQLRDEVVDAAKQQFREFKNEAKKAMGGMWYFKLYGPGPGETFHDRNKGTALNPMTLAVTHVPELFFDGPTAELVPFSEDRLKKIAATAKEHGTPLTVDAYAKGGTVPVARLAEKRARTVMDVLVREGVDPKTVTLNTHARSNARHATVSPSDRPTVYEPPASYTEDGVPEQRARPKP